MGWTAGEHVSMLDSFPELVSVSSLLAGMPVLPRGVAAEVTATQAIRRFGHLRLSSHSFHDGPFTLEM